MTCSQSSDNVLIHSLAVSFSFHFKMVSDPTSLVSPHRLWTVGSFEILSYLLMVFKVYTRWVSTNLHCFSCLLSWNLFKCQLSGGWSWKRLFTRTGSFQMKCGCHLFFVFFLFFSIFVCLFLFFCALTCHLIEPSRAAAHLNPTVISSCRHLPFLLAVFVAQGISFPLLPLAQLCLPNPPCDCLSVQLCSCYLLFVCSLIFIFLWTGFWLLFSLGPVLAWYSKYCQSHLCATQVFRFTILL